MGADLVVRGSIVIPAEELRWRFSRSSGPGGQGVNTADSRVQLAFDLTATTVIADPLKARALQRLGGRLVDGCIVVVASETRSQLQNRQLATKRLVEILDAALAPPPRKRRATKPTKGSVERRLQGKRSRGEVKRLRRSTASDDR